jgi:hypothetical protein
MSTPPLIENIVDTKAAKKKREREVLKEYTRNEVTLHNSTPTFSYRVRLLQR